MRIPNWLRSGIVTGAFVAIPGFVASTFDALDDIASWAAGETMHAPDLSSLRVAAVAVVFGGIAGGVNAAYRWGQERWSLGSPPVYPTRPDGGMLRRRLRPLRADRGNG